MNLSDQISDLIYAKLCMIDNAILDFKIKNEIHFNDLVAFGRFEVVGFNEYFYWKDKLIFSVALMREDQKIYFELQEAAA